MEEEEEEDMDGGEQRIEFKEDAITLDQARRITLQSAWRSIGS